MSMDSGAWQRVKALFDQVSMLPVESRSAFLDKECGADNGLRREVESQKGDQLEVEIQTKPKPLVMMLLRDGRFVGPSAFDITGQIIVGYNEYWVEERRVSDNTVVPGSASSHNASRDFSVAGPH